MHLSTMPSLENMPPEEHVQAPEECLRCRQKLIASALFSFAVVALMLSPLSIQISIGQETLTVGTPVEGVAPSPKARQNATSETVAATEAVATDVAITTSTESIQQVLGSEDLDAGVSEEVVDEVASDAVDVSEVSSDQEMNLETAIASALDEAAPADLSVQGQTFDRQSTDLQAADRQSSEITNPEVVELSVPPSLGVVPENLPAWVDQSDFSGEVHRFSVRSEEAASEQDLAEAIRRPLEAAVLDYLDQRVFGSQGTAEELGISGDYILRNLVSKPSGFTAPKETAFGKSYVRWVMVEVTPEQRARFQQMHQQSIQLTRIPLVGLGVLALVGVLGVSHLVIRRGVSKPTRQPLASPNFVSKEMPQQRSHFGILFLLFFMGSGALLLGLFAMFTVRQVSHERAIPALAVPSSRPSVIITKGNRHMTVRSGDDLPYEVETEISEALDTVFESNGQRIIQRVIRNP